MTIKIVSFPIKKWWCSIVFFYVYQAGLVGFYVGISYQCVSASPWVPSLLHTVPWNDSGQHRLSNLLGKNRMGWAPSEWKGQLNLEDMGNYGEIRTAPTWFITPGGFFLELEMMNFVLRNLKRPRTRWTSHNQSIPRNLLAAFGFDLPQNSWCFSILLICWYCRFWPIDISRLWVVSLVK